MDVPISWIKSKLSSAQLGQAVQRKDLGPRYEALPFLLDEIQVGGANVSNVKADAIRHKTNPPGNQGDDWATIGKRILSRFTQVGIDGPSRICVFVP